MKADVKTRRRYDSPHRREQAAGTRRKIIATAQPLFLEHGYAGTTVAAIARAAGVVVETVYRTFGSKVGLFGAVVEAALAGGVERAELPVEERPAIAAIIAEADPVRQVALYAATQPGIHRRAGPLLRAVRDAAALDPEVARVWGELEAQRYAGQARMAGLLASRGSLREGLSVETASDLIWALTSLALHDLFVVERGWTPEEYERWLTDALTRELLGV
ncbi:MAG: TetR/AcrR family transcriptional regulator [Chloroflexi bacterium]|nr:TetR/AcrR family transcriptional regulator [Chloroflexota bacterium]